MYLRVFSALGFKHCGIYRKLNYGGFLVKLRFLCFGQMTFLCAYENDYYI